MRSIDHPKGLAGKSLDTILKCKINQTGVKPGSKNAQIYSKAWPGPREGVIIE